MKNFENQNQNMQNKNKMKQNRLINNKNVSFQQFYSFKKRDSPKYDDKSDDNLNYFNVKKI